jgi:hypothetical protein
MANAMGMARTEILFAFFACSHFLSCIADFFAAEQQALPPPPMALLHDSFLFFALRRGRSGGSFDKQFSNSPLGRDAPDGKERLGDGGDGSTKSDSSAGLSSVFPLPRYSPFAACISCMKQASLSRIFWPSLSYMATGECAMCMNTCRAFCTAASC